MTTADDSNSRLPQPKPPAQTPVPVPLSLSGRETGARLPSLLNPVMRGGGLDDPFLPAGFLTPVRTWDVDPLARGAALADGAAEQRHDAGADEVVVLELTDGSIFISSAARLQATLQVSRPQLLAPDGTVLLEKLRVEGAQARGLLGEAAGGLLRRVSTLVVGRTDPVLEQAARLARPVELGISWAGTRALMMAIESRLSDPGPGLYRWNGADSAGPALRPAAFGDGGAQPDPARSPILVFIHGTASSTLGSFGDLRGANPALWSALEQRYPGGLYGFEHRTLSESPIENALQLAAALPAGAQVSLVSHSRGGLVADLLCLGDFDALIGDYAYAFEGTGDADPAEAARVLAELAGAHKEQRVQLRQLARLLREKRLQVQRYVRCASPAQGTRLASGNFDLFLSGILTLIGQVPYFFGNPLYSAFKRVVIEIARNRTNPHLVPGIEAMLPDAPMARLLRDAPPRLPLQMALIAGDIEGGNLLKRLGVLLTDFLLFENVDNDLVVDTASMLGGIAPHSAARVLFDRGADVSHFRYFDNDDTRSALRDWLVAADPAQLAAFQPLQAGFTSMDAAGIVASRGGPPLPDRPVVVVLPGVMGSTLRVNGDDRVWFDLPDLIAGGLEKIGWDRQQVEAETLWDRYYGSLCAYLAKSHRVQPFAYDWRQPPDVLGERLGEFLDALMKETQQPVRLLAHSMGGLVVRACAARRPGVMDMLMQRDGARLVMLGTPNQGAWSMVENLLGKGSTLRTLIRLDLQHDMQQVLDIVAAFRGPLALLPRPGFRDMFQGQPDGGGDYALQDSATWAAFRDKVRDFWFGDHHSALPAQQALDDASWLWRQDAASSPDGRPTLPATWAAKSIYVHGVAATTPCGVREEGGRLKMVGTSRGDGTVTWESGRIGGIGSFYYMPAAHGDLPATADYFPALAELLAGGATAALAQQPPALRDALQALPVTYDAGPPTADDADAIERGLMGGALRAQVAPRAKRRLEVAVRAMDLRFVFEPIMVGHYENDAIAGPESLIDRELLQGDLSERRSLGLYAGPRGTVTVALRVQRHGRQASELLSGAVVTGLGAYDGALSLAELTESVRSGVLRYLLQVIDVLGEAPRELSLATLLLGYNSSANLSVAASVEALVRGVIEANARFQQTTRLDIRVARLDIVELYLDTAITAVYALRDLAPTLAGYAADQGALLVCRDALEQGDGVRQRLFDSRAGSYWPRLMVTDAARSGDVGHERRTGPQIADRLRFLYIGQRARAEAVVQQRQPGLVETLVRQQIGSAVWQDSFGRMLFQLMVPHDFKEAARELERIVLVVDAYTANLPWELMLADDPSRSDRQALPLAVRTPVIRQFATNDFRRQVRQAIAHTALVIGNPSTRGFGAAFPDERGAPGPELAPLPGAQAEAEAVAAALFGLGYELRQVIGAGNGATSVLAELYAGPYRVLHVSGHGVYNLRHRDGRGRGGVVLSDGLLISAAEIGAMETVPELVFLNCCHLGQIEGTVSDGNRLAASVARELIDIGVRCVVVAGWAVNDRTAGLFATAFYEQLFQHKHAFGDAVFEARQQTWKAAPADITWGAFQAYGDPGWRADPRTAAAGPDRPGLYASPEELLDELASVRAELSRRTSLLSQRDAEAQAQRVEQLLKSRTPPGWAMLPALNSALGGTWRDLGRFDRARAAYLAAIQAEDAAGRVPIRDIEQLANVETRLAEEKAAQEPDARNGGAAGAETAEQLLDLALARLDGLEKLVSAGGRQPNAPVFNAERSMLLGSALKRRASLHARRLLAAAGQDGNGERERDIQRNAEVMAATLEQAVAAYRNAEGTPGDSRFTPAAALNRLALDALTPWTDGAARDAALALAQRCREDAVQRQAKSPTVWGAVLLPESLLVESLLDGSLGRAGDAGQRAYEHLAQAYSDTLAELSLKPADIDTMVSQMALLALFFDALAMLRDDDALRRTAQRLQDIAQLLQPGRERREPPAAPDRAVARKAARHAVAKKTRPRKA
ncbi:CHAT domain-containing protein [Noviherbaspirillum suwonense]|uniref:Lecithin:cholesterol acyltransferase n=1 Tax=Noviherbaspirillum suwonense TaxID=1224511 RepID=A0ABY1QF08_9BURK|nr:CHAT domain-containing protein [Noviherbaspirillum suwonense]SMP65865.1 Lecithin:cholesterol acyltransferase [Noviherbaspirillum suwonense]